MTYSAAVHAEAGESLEDAQRRKFDRLCDALGLGPDDHVLEIGCGWGGFAMHAASTRGLADRVDVRLWDYYLASCEAMFRTRVISNLHLVMGRTGRGMKHDSCFMPDASCLMLSTGRER